jgi:hypothetical protein
MKKKQTKRDAEAYKEAERRVQNILSKESEGEFKDQFWKEINQASSFVQACMLFILFNCVRDEIKALTRERDAWKANLTV